MPDIYLRPKLVLIHAIEPRRDEPRENYMNFSQETALLQLPNQTEKLASNVWVVPDQDEAYMLLSRLARKHAIELRILPFRPACDWQLLSHPG